MHKVRRTALVGLVLLTLLLPTLTWARPNPPRQTDTFWTWQIETVDSAGDVGRYSSLLVVNGDQDVYITYYGSGDLKNARSLSGGPWELSTIDSTGDVGLFTDQTNFLLNRSISYYDATNGDLKYSQGVGSITVDSTGNVGQYSSIAMRYGNWPGISYYDVTNGDLKYAYFNGSSWIRGTVDSTGDVGRYTSLGTQANGYPAISYYDVTNGNLKYAWWNPVDAAWTLEVAEAAGDTGMWTSLAFDASGRAHVAYTSGGGFNVKIATRQPDATWTYELVDIDTLGQISLRLDSQGEAHVAYLTAQGLQYAHGSGTDWTYETVDPGADVGQTPSLFLDSQDRPYISYYDGVTMDLKYAHGCLDATFRHAPEPACVNTSVQFTNSTRGFGPFTYAWAFGDGGTSNQESPAHLFADAGLYTTALTATAACGSDRYTETVTIWGRPEAAYTYTPTVVCQDDPVWFYNTTTASGTVSYQWNFDDGAVSTATNPVHAWNAAGSYQVDLLAINECAADMESQVVPVYDTPGVEAIWTPTEPEVHVPVVFTATSSSPISVTYTWDFGDGATASGPTVTHAYDLTGTYGIMVTGTTACGYSLATGPLTVICNEVLSPSLQWQPLTPTVGLPVTLTAQAAGTEPITYIWDLGDGLTATGSIVQHTYASTGTYTVHLVAGNDCGRQETAALLPVADWPTARFSANTPVCLGEPLLLTNTSSGAAPLSFRWDFGDGLTSTLRAPTHTYALDGSYTVTLRVQNSVGSDQVSRAVAVDHAPYSTTISVQPASPTPGQVITFTAQAAGTGPLLYSWDMGDASTGSGAVITHVYAVTGTYTVTLASANRCGTEQAVTPVPVAFCTAPAGLAVAYSPAFPHVGEVVHLTATVRAGRPPVTVAWDFDGDGNADTYGFTAAYAYQAPGTHAVTTVAWNACGMTEQLDTPVTVRLYTVDLPVILRGYYAGDLFEVDDSPDAASILPLGALQEHTFYRPAAPHSDDRDWVRLTLTAGGAYRFWTQDLGGNDPTTRNDTRLALYAEGNYNTPVAENDDAGSGNCPPELQPSWPASCFVYTPTSSGVYYLRVDNYYAAEFGIELTYTLGAVQQ